MFSIKPTFAEMIKAHKEEIDNHQKLIDEFLKRADETKNKEERMVCLVEAHRNKDHQLGHRKMLFIYTYLNETKNIY